MAGPNQTNTFGEFLQKLLRDIAKAKTAPDADLPYLVELESMVLGRIRQPIDQADAQTGQPLMGPLGSDGGVGMGPGMRPSPAPLPPGPVSMGPMAGSMPPGNQQALADEIRRAIR